MIYIKIISLIISMTSYFELVELVKLSIFILHFSDTYLFINQAEKIVKYFGYRICFSYFCQVRMYEI